jgi:hypothetical protein
MKHKETYVCKRLRLLEYLINRGFEVKATIPEPTNPKYRNWIFENSDELESVLNEYFSNKLIKD